MLNDELITYLFDAQPHFLTEPMTGWLASSRRFTDFVTTHQNKIRKKIRTSRDPERLRDLQLELETAYLLLREKSLHLEYEPQHPREGRSPDFAVGFTTSLTFMVEVTRLRTAQQTALPFEDRFTEMVGSKLGQLLPQRSNVLLVGIEAPSISQDEIRALMLRLQQRAERNDSTIMQRHGFRDRADFFRHYQRLSALLVRGVPPLKAGESIILWINPQANYPLPSKALTTLSRSHTV